MHSNDHFKSVSGNYNGWQLQWFPITIALGKMTSLPTLLAGIIITIMITIMIMRRKKIRKK